MVLDSCSRYIVGTSGSSHSSMPSTCSFVFSFLKNRFLVLNWAPLPATYCRPSSCFLAATLKWSCFNFSDIIILFWLLDYLVFSLQKKENKELSLHNLAAHFLYSLFSFRLTSPITLYYFLYYQEIGFETRRHKNTKARRKPFTIF